MKKIKIDKDNSGKKTKKKEKNRMGKHCSNQQYFKEKTTKLNFQPAQYGKHKFDKDNFRKQIDKKNMGKHCSKKKSCEETL